MGWFPAEVGDLADRQRGEFRCCKINKGISPASFQGNDLAIHRCIGQFEARLRRHHGFGLVAHALEETLEHVLAEFVALIKDCNFYIRNVCKDMLCIDPGFGVITYIPGNSSREVFVVAQAVCAIADK